MTHPLIARALALTLVGAALLLVGCHEATTRTDRADAQPPQPSSLDVATVRLTTADGRTHSYQVEIARTEPDQARGLMYRRELSRDRGMLFPFKPARSVSFWMENTYLPLDIIFIGEDGRVLNISTGKPLSRETLPSAGYAAAVLELNAGEAARIGLGRGDHVDIPS